MDRHTSQAIESRRDQSLRLSLYREKRRLDSLDSLTMTGTMTETVVSLSCSLDSTTTLLCVVVFLSLYICSFLGDYFIPVILLPVLDAELTNSDSKEMDMLC